MHNSAVSNVMNYPLPFTVLFCREKKREKVYNNRDDDISDSEEEQQEQVRS